MNLTPLQQKVFDLAKARMQDQEWFRGVCLNGFPTDDIIEKEGIEDCVDMVVIETEYWDHYYWWDKSCTH